MSSTPVHNMYISDGLYAGARVCVYSSCKKFVPSPAHEYVMIIIIIIIIIKAEKFIKYKDLRIEIQRMWNIKTNVIGATGTISKSFRKYVSNIPGKHEVKELQKTAILGTAHILRKELM